MAGERRGGPASERIVAWLRRHRRAQFTWNEVRSDLRRGLADREIDAGLEELRKLGAVRRMESAPEEAAPRRGRKVGPRYAVHPELVSQFQSGTEEEFSGLSGFRGASAPPSPAGRPESKKTAG